MANIKIGKRLLKISEYVKDNSSVIDVGCDHCILCMHIYKTKKNMQLIACDINEGPLNNAKLNLQRNGLQFFIKLCHSDGLKNITFNNPNYIVIAGMGGELIFNIISQVDWTRNKDITFILQPMSDHDFLRKNLLKLGFCISCESVVIENCKLYLILKVNYVGKNIEKEDIYFYFGELMNKFDSDSIEYKTMQYEKVDNIIKGRKLSSNYDFCDISFLEQLKNEMRNYLDMGEENGK